MSNNGTVDFRRCAARFKALSNPKRLELFCRLVAACGTDARCCTDEEVSLCVARLARQLRLAASTVSHHMKELHAAGLVDVVRKGKFNEFRLHPPALSQLIAVLRADGSCCGSTSGGRRGRTLRKGECRG